jgi:hypothetical protein
MAALSSGKTNVQMSMRYPRVGAALVMALVVGACSDGAVSGGMKPGGTGVGEGAPGTGTMRPAGGTPMMPVETEAPPQPGVVTVRRLNHAEYNNTVRDLLGTELRPADTFLADNSGAGFDTVGAATSLPPAYVRDYEEAAYALIDDLFASAERRDRIVTCDVDAEGPACAEVVLGALARRAWRRPVSAEEVQGLLAPLQVAEERGEALSVGLRYALASVLVSPHFIFKVELDPDPSSAVAHRVTDHELATRLSYALWSTMPDEELSRAADEGRLQADGELLAQFERMIAHPRASALARDFAGQWLEFRDLPSHEVEPRAFPEVSAELLTAMQREAELFFGDFIASSRSPRELMTARFTYVNPLLARHYDLAVPPGASESEFWKADTSAVPRSGLLTLGALLTTTSLSSRTSPVKRGEFVLGRILCSEIPPPPPEVTGLDANDQTTVETNLTLRQRMEQHRSSPACMGCHTLMDPIGFGLENYDAVGGFRTEEGGLPLDSSGELPGGAAFSGALELAALLAEDARLSECVTEKFMTYALGRFLDQPDDALWIKQTTERAVQGGGGLKVMMRELFMSEAFRSRQAVALVKTE